MFSRVREECWLDVRRRLASTRLALVVLAARRPPIADKLMAANSDTRVDVLQRHLTEMRRRKGPHSIIAKTLAAALRCGTDRDLAAGLFAYAYFNQYYEQLTLEESRSRARPSRPPTKVISSRPATEQDIERARAPARAEQERKDRDFWAKEIEKRERERALPHTAFGDSRLPDGPDFARHDKRSTAGRRHLLAKAPRSKRRVVLKKKRRT